MLTPVFLNVAIFYRIHIWDDCMVYTNSFTMKYQLSNNVGDMGPLGYRCVSTLAQYWMVTTFAKDTQLLLVKDSKSIWRIHVYKVESLRFTKYRHLSIKAFLLAPLSKWISKLNLSSFPWWAKLSRLGVLPGIWLEEFRHPKSSHSGRAPKWYCDISLISISLL